MLATVLQIPTGSGLLSTLAQLATVGATLVLLLMLVALGSYAYKHLRGDGIEWPDEDDDGVDRADGDDEWKYY